jgi:hypothetical protein
VRFVIANIFAISDLSIFWDFGEFEKEICVGSWDVSNALEQASSFFAKAVKLLPLPQPPVRARMDARTNPSAQRATQLRSVLARVYAVSIKNQITTTVP